MKKKVVIWIGILVVVSLVISIPLTLGKKKDKIPRVRTAAVQKGDISSYLTTTAVIKSKNIKEYYGSQLKVTAVNFKVGDKVKAGETIISYDVQDLKNAVKQAEIQYNNSILQKQELLNQKKSLEEKKSIINNQSVESYVEDMNISNIPNSEEAVKAVQGTMVQNTKVTDIPEISEEKIKQADNAISLTKLSLDSAKSKLNSVSENITSEFDGVITAINVSEGSVGNMAQPAVVVQDIDNLKAVISLGKYDAAKIAIDQEAQVISDGNRVKGKVFHIDPVAKKIASATGSDVILNADIDILEKLEGIKPEFDTDVEILLAKKESVLKVPTESIKSDKEGKNYVYLLMGNKAVEREVSLGLQSDIDVEIVEGVNEGEKVILNPTGIIQDGTLVEEAQSGDIK
ncbi:HlyD family efflux transporter periplasmic adaptor subunit [Clostridium sp. MSJ-4]|uniref:HlyD family efflux transporter periplasmic adaptor subunit n=1 Tax=Clostridium simiarum TaxID=2841506 RepID=A0ABS6F3E2_9CLOT|nr:biotin/lipoyl-binding protein [Clostridium simiarum]MBU5592915.1 HlyD family efflux transporter periplasmic adaptor subunit [Clostridium simiarum]